MKKYLSILCAAAIVFGAASCRKADERKVSTTTLTPLKTITVRIAGSDADSDARLALDEETRYTKFQVGDQLFGWDATGNYTYSCTKAEGDEAEFELISEYAPSSEPGTKVNLIYANGYDAEDIDGGALALDIKSQNATGFSQLPIVMTGQGIVDENGGCEVTFENETSYISIKDCPTPAAGGMRFYSVAATNLYPQMTITIGKDGDFVRTPGSAGTITNSAEIISTQDGEISSCMATFPTPEGASAANIVFIADSDEGTCYYGAGKKTVPANTIINITEKEFTSEAPVIGIVELAETGESFANLTEAVAKANAYSGSCTLKMLQDFTDDAAQYITNSNGVTLDLNGFTLTHAGSNRIGIKNSGKLTVTDGSAGGTGTITQATASSSTITYGSGSLTIAGGTITKAPGSAYNVLNITGGTLTVTGGKVTNDAVQGTNYLTRATIYASAGKVTISGGTVSSSAANALAITGGELEVTGGEIEAQSADAGNAIYLGEGSSDITISGGYIHSKKATVNITASSRHALALSGDCTFASASSNTFYSNSTATEPNSTVTVTGGKYKAGKATTAVFSVANTSTTKTKYVVSECIYYGSDISDSRLAPGSKRVDNTDPATKTDYPKRIEYQGAAVTLTIGSGDPQSYETVEAAVTDANAASQDCKITLHKDIAVGAQTNVTNTAAVVTLDLNGCKLTYNGTNRIRVTNASAAMIITDSSNGQTGEIVQTAAASGAISHYTGTLTIKGGKISNVSTSTVNTVNISGGTLNVAGGEITLSVASKSTITASAGTVNVTGGVISATESKAPGITMSGTAVVNVSDAGKITSLSNAISASAGTLTIEGGYFKSGDGAAVIYKSKDAAIFNIYGGYYNKAVNGTYLTSEYECVDSGVSEYIKKVQKKPQQ